MNQEVNVFLNQKQLPLRNEIDQLRSLIMDSSFSIKEIIKWNSPNYVFEGKDFLTMKIEPKKVILLVFHRGAKASEPLKRKFIDDDTHWLEWKGNDRAIMTFGHQKDIEVKATILREIIHKWIKNI